jgi:hypothetical protein
VWSDRPPAGLDSGRGPDRYGSRPALPGRSPRVLRGRARTRSAGVRRGRRPLRGHRGRPASWPPPAGAEPPAMASAGPLAIGRTVRPSGGCPDAARIRAAHLTQPAGGGGDFLQPAGGCPEQTRLRHTRVAATVVLQAIDDRDYPADRRRQAPQPLRHGLDPAARIARRRHRPEGRRSRERSADAARPIARPAAFCTHGSLLSGRPGRGSGPPMSPSPAALRRARSDRARRRRPSGPSAGRPSARRERSRTPRRRGRR